MLINGREKVGIANLKNPKAFIDYSQTIDDVYENYNLTKEIQKIPNKRDIQQIASNHLSDIDFKDFMKLYRNYTKEPYSFLVNDTTSSSDNLLRFRKNLLSNEY